MTWRWLDDRLLDRTREKRARAALDEARREAASVIDQAFKEGKRGGDLQAERQEAYFEVRLAYEHLVGLTTRRLLREADRRDLPVPVRDQESDYWDVGFEGDWLLTDEGRSHLKAASRAESFSEWQLKLAWGSLVTASLGGLAGVLALIVALATRG